MSVLGCVCCVGRRVWTQSLKRPVSRAIRRSAGGLGRCPRAVSCGRRHLPLRSEDATPRSRACLPLLVLPGRVGSAGLPGAFWCASPFLWPLCLSALLDPLRAGVALFLFLGFFRFPLFVGFFFFFLRCSLCAPPLSPAFSGFRHRVPWALALCVVCFVGLPLLGSPCALAAFVFPVSPLDAPWRLLPPPPFCVSRFWSLPLGAPFFFAALPLPTGWALVASSSHLLPPPPSCLFCWSPAARLSVCSRCFCVSLPPKIWRSKNACVHTLQKLRKSYWVGGPLPSSATEKLTAPHNCWRLLRVGVVVTIQAPIASPEVELMRKRILADYERDVFSGEVGLRPGQ